MAASDMCSSPARTTLYRRPTNLSSSPLLDVRDLGAKKPKVQTLRSGSAATPIPAEASSTFTSASDFLRLARENGDDSLDMIDEPAPLIAKKAPTKRTRKTATRKTVPELKAKNVPKRVAKDVIVLSSDGVTPKIVRHENSTRVEAEKQAGESVGGKGDEGTPLKVKPWKKYKAPADSERAGLGEEQAELAKPSAKAKTQKKKSKLETASRHFSRKSPVAGKPVFKEKRPRISTPEPTNLEPAVQRRTDWTPPRPDTTFSESNTFNTPLATSTPADEDTGERAEDLFKKLRETYGHKAVDAALPTAPQQQSAKILGKRKVIEMVAVNQSSRLAEPRLDLSPAKEKAPKKKPRTITELAMAAYAPQAESANVLPEDDSLLGYFSIEGGAQEESSKNAAGKGKGKATRATKSKKKVSTKRAVLLSPQSAMMQSARQDFVFGTSSQLAREQSPTLLKDLREALKASAIIEEDSSFASPPVGERLKTKQPDKGLWFVSARDEDGEMVNVDVINLVDSPTFPEDDAILDPWKQLSLDPAGVGIETTDLSLIEIDGRPLPTSEDKSSNRPIPKLQSFTPQRKITINAFTAATPEHSESSFPLITDLLEGDEMPPPSNQQQTQEEVREPPSTATASVQKQRPNYELFTDTKLAKEISRYGFKAVKTRSGMISLLDMCWKSKNQAPAAGATFSTSALGTHTKRKQAVSSTTAPTAPPAKKPRGRANMLAKAEAPKQNSAAEEAVASPKRKRGRSQKEAVGAEKAESSMPPPPEPQPGPSTPKRRKRAAQPGRERPDSDVESEIETGSSSSEQLVSPAGNGASISEDTEISLNLSPNAQLSALFSHITKAVTSAPRTTDPANPSWHEKMLMYDPIILEDLTAWLNSGQLTRVGHDDEVAPADVKKWCESRSICCLWRVNLHGKERKRL